MEPCEWKISKRSPPLVSQHSPLTLHRPPAPEQKLHVRTVPLGEQPRRIAHQESSRTFAVTCTKATISGGQCARWPPVFASALRVLA
jgi:hypothetical protein